MAEFKISEHKLRQMYLDEGMSAIEIGKSVDVSYRTIYNWIKIYEIEARVPILEHKLRQMYLDEGMSAIEIGKLVDVSYGTIYNWLKIYGIESRIPILEHKLRQMYLYEGMSIPKIAKEVGVSYSRIHNLMKSYGIPRRTNSEAGILRDNRGPNHPQWTGGPKKYCYKFSQRFREAVRERDDYTCQNCGKIQEENVRKLAVHHIHYDAENCYPDVLCLCHSCHMSSNFNRDEWETHYWCILRDRGLLEWEPPWAEAKIVMEDHT